MLRRIIGKIKQYKTDIGLLENGFDKIRLNLKTSKDNQDNRTSRHTPEEYQLMIDHIHLLIQKVTPTIEQSEINIKVAKETILEMNSIIRRYQTEKDQTNGKTY